jgi:DNA-directed RNA polymerase III subunit RPC1
VAQDGASNEDDLTVKLTEIVFTNALIKQGLAKGAPTPQFMARRLILFFHHSKPTALFPGAVGISTAFRRDVRQL